MAFIGGTYAQLQIVEVRMTSPLEVVAALPWEWFATAGGGMVFVKAIEAWLNAPGRIRVERQRLRTEEAQHRADAAEAQLREKSALDQIEQLGRVGELVLEDAVLEVR